MSLTLFDHETTNSYQTTIANFLIRLSYLGKSHLREKKKKPAGKLKVLRTNSTTTNLAKHEVDFSFPDEEGQNFRKYHI